jgi:hypothetical protein
MKEQENQNTMTNQETLKMIKELFKNSNDTPTMAPGPIGNTYNGPKNK